MRVLFALAAVVGAIGAGSALAVGGPLFPQPDRAAKTVPPAGPGSDYKSNPAPPEIVDPPAGPLTPAQMREIWTSLDRNDSPNVRVCVNRDGSGAIQFIRPAEPDAETVRAPAGQPLAEMEVINDKGPCR